jgi:outer membrane protein
MNRIFKFSFIAIFLCIAGSGKLPSSEIHDSDTKAEIRILTIQEAVQMALSGSPEILIARAQSERSREAVRESRSLNRPQVVTGTGLAYNNGFPLSIEGSAPSIFQVGLSQSLFSKRNNNLIREAEEAGNATRFNEESAGKELATKTAISYYSLHQAREMAALASERLDAAQRQQKITDDLYRAGRVRPVDVTLAQTAASSARQQALVAEEQAMIAETELKNYTGLAESVSIRTLEPRIDSPAFDTEPGILIQQALEKAPEIRQAEADIRARGFHLEAEKGERLPQLNLVGEYALFSRSNNYEDYFSRFSRNNYLLGVSIQLPVFDGFRASSRVAQSRQELLEARYRLQRVQSDLKLAVQRGLSSLRIARGANQLARDEAEAARQNMRASEALLESGKISGNELEDIRARLFQKEYERLESELVLFQRKLELLGIIGNIPVAFQ